MDDKLAVELNYMIGTLTRFIASLRDHDLRDAAQILSISKLDLQMRRHGIQPEELRAVCEVLQGQADAPAPVPSLSAAQPRLIRLERRRKH